MAASPDQRDYKLKLPDGISPNDVENAIEQYERGVDHNFGPSTDYDILYKNKRYPPKAIVGIAAGNYVGESFIPDDFGSGLKSKCFRILEKNGFQIVTKAEHDPFPDEISNDEKFQEGSVKQVLVNKYERDPKARKICIDHYGYTCSVCEFDFERVYGSLGQGFIHVHHLMPISELGHDYEVDPLNDLRPVCPNCHAMLHKRKPPLSIEELRQLIED